jgi:hypothetical protein
MQLQYITNLGFFWTLEFSTGVKTGNSDDLLARQIKYICYCDKVLHTKASEMRSATLEALVIYPLHMLNDEYLTGTGTFMVY